MTYGALDLIGFGFVIGFLIVLITYLLLHITGEKIPTIKRGLLIIVTLFIIIYTPPIEKVSKIWLIISLIIFAIIINNLINTLYNLGSDLYRKYISPQQIKKINHIIFLGTIFLGIILLIISSQTAILIVYNLTKHLILLCVGIWLALKLLYKNKEEEHVSENKN